MKLTTCRLCKKELKPHERAEGFCDTCLRAHTTSPSPPKDKRG